jgi:hypothetical protein
MAASSHDDHTGLFREQPRLALQKLMSYGPPLIRTNPMGATLQQQLLTIQ